MAEKEWEKLSGEVEHIVFHNEDNGWTVLDLSVGADTHKVVGTFPAVNVGDRLTLTGYFGEHSVYGPQFVAVSFERSAPEGTTAILRYLASGAIKGIGDAMAVRLVKKFGDQTLRIFEEAPERLAEVRGISQEKARQIAEDYAAKAGLREVILAFSGYGLTPAESLRCWKLWGQDTVNKIKENPYVLYNADLSLSFERVDSIAREMQIDLESPERIESGILFVLRHNLGNGHSCLPQDKLIVTTAGLLEVSPDLTAAVLQNMVARFVVREVTFGEREFIFLAHLYEAERYVSARMTDAVRFFGKKAKNLEKQLDTLESLTGIAYEKNQRLAVRKAVEEGVLILTGGPGTGKTTTLKAIITILESMGEKVAIAAPTGRAAKRITEVTGREAKTIHRLLEVQWDEGDSLVFARNERDPLEADALVVDEMSMVDVLLFHSLLRAMKPGCRLIMVGDTDQLPSVGAGSVLHDLIACGSVPTVRLTEVFRQAMESRIITNAHRIVSGEMPELSAKEGDFFFLPKSSAQHVVNTVLDLCYRRLPSRYGVSVFQGIQVLCPGRKGPIGTIALNEELQALFNPESADKPEVRIEGKRLRVGDKVMHTRNNYDIPWKSDRGETGMGVFNGDIGVLSAISLHDETLTVTYDDHTATYTKQDAKDLELAYAVTVHKSQGSEFPVVILPLFRNQPLLCYRNLLYTAVTRAKTLLIAVGSSQTIADMVENDRKTLRYSGLQHFMEEQGSVSL